MKSKRTKSFRKLYDALPLEIQEQANAAYRLFRTNPAHSSLDFKQVSSKGPTYSVRIGILTAHWLCVNPTIGCGTGSGLTRNTTNYFSLASMALCR